jgi:hypothetical protein
MAINCGFLDNICHDYNRGDIITPKKEIDMMVKPLSWDDQARIIKWHNKAVRDGVGSLAHFKLCCIASDIIAENWDAYCRWSLCPSVKMAWKWSRTHHRTARKIDERLGVI